MEAAQKRLSDFMSKLLRGAREGVHLQALPLLDCPPWLAERGHSRACRKRVVVDWGFMVYMTQCGISPIATFNLFDSGRESYCATAIFADASARSFPRILV